MKLLSEAINLTMPVLEDFALLTGHLNIWLATMHIKMLDLMSWWPNAATLHLHSNETTEVIF